MREAIHLRETAREATGQAAQVATCAPGVDAKLRIDADPVKRYASSRSNMR
jgi:hypothetical protein